MENLQESQSQNPVNIIQNNSVPSINIEKWKGWTLLGLIILSIAFVAEFFPVWIGLMFTFNPSVILIGLLIGGILLATLIVAWIKYRKGHYKSSRHILIIPLVVELLVVAGLIVILSPMLLVEFAAGNHGKNPIVQTTSSINQIRSSDNITTDDQSVSVASSSQSTTPSSTDHQFDIMTVTYGGNATINKAVVAAVSQIASSSAVTPQTTTNFSKGTNYVMYFSGVSGFTENHPYGAPAGFVDAKGSIVLYDGNNKIIFNEPDIFSSYVGGVPAKDFSYLTFKLNLSANFKAGTYRWESMVTDNKDSSNYLKGVVNFTVN